MSAATSTPMHKRSTIEPYAAKPRKSVGSLFESFAEIGDSMTMNSQATERVTGQTSPVGATFAVGALLATSAILTFSVGVFALIADKVVVSGPGYQYTFQITGWGWVNLLTGLMLAVVALGGWCFSRGGTPLIGAD